MMVIDLDFHLCYLWRSAALVFALLVVLLHMLAGCGCVHPIWLQHLWIVMLVLSCCLLLCWEEVGVSKWYNLPHLRLHPS